MRNMRIDCTLVNIEIVSKSRAIGSQTAVSFISFELLSGLKVIVLD